MVDDHENFFQIGALVEVKWSKEDVEADLLPGMLMKFTDLPICASVLLIVKGNTISFPSAWLVGDEDNGQKNYPRPKGLVAKHLLAAENSENSEENIISLANFPSFQQPIGV